MGGKQKNSNDDKQKNSNDDKQKKKEELEQKNIDNKWKKYLKEMDELESDVDNLIGVYFNSK